MRNSSKKISVVLLSLSLLMSQTAYAARMGGSKNSGMQRSVSTAPANSGSNTAATSTAGAAGAAATPQKSGMGMGTVLAGAAAGAVGGYMLGKASSNNESGHVSQSQGSQIPWGIIMILGALLAIGLMIFRRKTVAPSLGGNQTNGASPQPSTNNSFSIPSVNNGGNGYTPGQYTNPNPVNNQPLAVEKTADGVEAQYFLRQAKGMFLHIQSMNTPENVSEVEKYMTPELYLDIKSTITANDFVADFSQLDGRLLESVVNNDKYVASVLFSGKVSDSPTSPVIDFNEIWHFVKPLNNVNAKWLVAGIQQTSQT